MGRGKGQEAGTKGGEVGLSILHFEVAKCQNVLTANECNFNFNASNRRQRERVREIEKERKRERDRKTKKEKV